MFYIVSPHALHPGESMARKIQVLGHACPEEGRDIELFHEKDWCHRLGLRFSESAYEKKPDCTPFG